MKLRVNWIFALFVIILLCCISFEEGFANQHKRRPNYRGTEGRHGAGNFRHRAPPYPRRMAWREGPSNTIYDGVNYHWGGHRVESHPKIYDYYPSWLFSAKCRSGCGYIGKNMVGCINPTNLPDSCIFASDCYGC